jgi:transposase
LNQPTLPTQTTTNPSSLYLALELSNKSWTLLFSDGAKHRRVAVPGGDVSKLLEEAQLARKKFKLPEATRLISCYEAGRDGFWVHRALEGAGALNFVLDPASIEVDRRARRLKTDRVDAEKLMSLLLRHQGGEKKVLRIVNVPTVQEEDDRRRGRELERLTHEKTAHLCRMRALLALHGVKELKLKSLEKAKCWTGEDLPRAALDELLRERERLQLIEDQMKLLRLERETLLIGSPKNRLVQQVASLMRLKGIGPGSAWLFGAEFFAWRNFQNRRQVGSAAGLVSVPFSSGDAPKDQGISKAGNARVRTMAVQIAWSWLKWQPKSALSLWYKQRFESSKRFKRVGIVALARRLLIALWRYLKHGLVPEGAVLDVS